MPSTNGYRLKRSVLWCILYCRVSTSEQARSGYSLAQQLEALREYAAREGYQVLEEVVDPGESGATLERPGHVRDLVAAGGVLPPKNGTKCTGLCACGRTWHFPAIWRCPVM